MAREPACIKNLRLLTRADPQSENLEAIENELYSSGSDRATAVMFGSFVETSLGRLLAMVMRDDLNADQRRRLSDSGGPLGTFSSKIITAYALKLIGPITLFDLDLVRCFRNEFAHSRMSFDFKTDEVHAACDQLKVVDMQGTYIPLRYMECVTHEDLKDASDKRHPKTRFITECHTLAYRMHVKCRQPQAGDVAFIGDPLP